MVFDCAGEGRKRSGLTVSTPGEYILGGNDVELTGLIGYIKTPSSALEQCLLKKASNGKLGLRVC